MRSAGEIARGIAWTGVEKVFGQAVGFAQGIVLARLLCPDDFGLAAMLGIFLTLGNALSDCGLGSALVAFGERFGSAGPMRALERRAAAFNVGVGAAVYALLALCAPAIAAYYGRDELRGLVLVMGATVPLNAACVVWNARLNREMRFGLLSRINMAVTLVAFLLVVGLALAGCGVWSIAAMNVAWALTRILLFALASRTDGAASARAPADPSAFRDCLRYGWRLMASELLGTLYMNSYHFVIGKLSGAPAVGMFARGHRWAQLPSDVVDQSVGRVAFAALSRGEGGARRYLALDLALVWPGLLVLGAFATPVVRFVLGEPWLPCVPYLRILLVGVAFAPFSLMAVNVMKAAGRSDLVLKAEGWKRVPEFTLIAAVAAASVRGWTADCVAALCWVKVANDVYEAVVNGLFCLKVRTPRPQTGVSP